jgi:hypothetical protein
MRAVGEIGEAVFRENPVAVAAKEARRGLDDETVMFELDKSASNRILVETEFLSKLATRCADFAVV